jgi:long-subunit fatty acid transport protein
VRYFISLTASAVAISFATNSLAQGYYSGTQGARAAGRAGAFTARADDLSAVELNPAGLARIGKTLIQIGNRFSHNQYDYTRQPTLDWGHNGVLVQFDKVSNETPWQALDPMVGVASNLGLRDWGFALAAYAPAGIAQEQYPAGGSHTPQGGGQRYMMLSRKTQMINYTASVAWKFENLFGIGVSLQWIAVPSLKYRLVVNGNPATRAGTNGENPVWSGTDVYANVSGSDPFTPNAIVGAWFRPLEYLECGLSAQVIPATIRAKGTLAVDPAEEGLDPIRLMRGNERANDVSLALPLPLKLREGVRYRHIRQGREVFDVELDVAYEFWSRVRQFTLESNGIEGKVDGQNVSIGRIDIQNHWKNTVSVMLGGDYAVLPDTLTLRGGTFYTSALSDPAYTQIAFVGGPQVGGTLGLSVFAGGLEVAAAYEYHHQIPVSITETESRVYQQAPGSTCKAPYADTSACNEHYLGIPAPAVNAGTYVANSHVAALDLLYRF